MTLRLVEPRRTDWAFSAEGSLILFDPAVVTDRVLDRFVGLQTIIRCVLGWMNGGGAGASLGFLGAEFHATPHDRESQAEAIAELTRLGWLGAIALLPFTIASNGAEIRLRTAGLTPEEQKIHLAHQRQRHRGPGREPERTWLVTRGPRLGLTWDFLLGFTAEEKRARFGPGYQVEVDWPAGAHVVEGWTFPDHETSEEWLSRYLVRLSEWTARS
ncbi:MAG: hypothetical protein U0794_01930 [Isosphaeraceae bacterium]